MSTTARTNGRRRVTALGLAGAAGLAVAGGLFAWSANVVTVDAPAAGTTNIIASCTTDPLDVRLGAPLPGDTEFNSLTMALTSSGGNAAACDALDYTVFALDGEGAQIATATGTLAVEEGIIDTGDVNWSASVPLPDLARISVQIQ